MQGYCVIYLASYLRFGVFCMRTFCALSWDYCPFCYCKSLVFVPFFTIFIVSGIFILSSFCVSIIWYWSAAGKHHEWYRRGSAARILHLQSELSVGPRLCFRQWFWLFCLLYGTMLAQWCNKTKSLRLTLDVWPNAATIHLICLKSWQYKVPR